MHNKLKEKLVKILGVLKFHIRRVEEKILSAVLYVFFWLKNFIVTKTKLLSSKDKQLKLNQKSLKENFPVASFLIPKKARKAIHNLYNFARAADDIADDHTKTRWRRKEELEGVYNAILEGSEVPDWAVGFVGDCKNSIFDVRHGLNLLEAFIQDNEKSEYESFEDTLSYCDKSAATIGRMFLEATQEFDCDINKADEICKVLQLLNHLQDLKKDYLENNRMYFDKSFFPDKERLGADFEDKEAWHGKDKILKMLRNKITYAKDFPEQILSFWVRAELYGIIQVCRFLISKLKRNDILKSRVELSKIEKIACVAIGIFKACKVSKWRKASRLIALGAKSSFVSPLRLLAKDKFADMMAFYAFCRRADDMADDLDNHARPLESILNFEKEVKGIGELDFYSYPKHPLVREVNLICKKYDIDKNLLLKIIEGQKMDLHEKMLFPTYELLEEYCYNVASCVGLASVKIFGYKKENEEIINEFAINLGKGLQLINIIRDVREDAKIGRVYIPKELAMKYGFEKALSYRISMHYEEYSPQIKLALRELAVKAEGYLYSALNMLPAEEEPSMRVAILMARIYEAYLKKMKAADFEFDKKDISLNLLEKYHLFVISH